jgi:hypothetical protein
MKKLFILSAVVLAGLLVFAACKTEVKGNGESVISTSALEKAILEAYDAKFGVREADKASDVAKGLFWVTPTQMATFTKAIRDAEAVKDDPSSQAEVNTAENKLKGATTTFIAAKNEGTAASITLSGTITVKYNGQTVPRVVIYAHDDTWVWTGEAGLLSPGENAPWEIITKPFSESTEIKFRVGGYTADSSEELFNIDVKDLSRNIHNQDVSGININLGALKIITMSGTINISHNGEPVPSVVIQANRKSDGFFLGETTVVSAGNNTPWSIKMEALDAETEIMFGIVGFSDRYGWNSTEDWLFEFWGQDFGTTVKDQNKSGIALHYITLSGTINISYDGKPVPSVKIWAEKKDNGDYLRDTSVLSAGSGTPWSITMKALDADTDIVFCIQGFNSDKTEGNPIFSMFSQDFGTKVVKDQNKSGIALNFNTTLGGTINVTYDGEQVPYIRIQAYFYPENDHLGETTFTGDNTFWSMPIKGFASDTAVRFGIYGFPDSNLDWDDLLFYYPVDDEVQVKDQSIRDIVLNLGNIEP